MSNMTLSEAEYELSLVNIAIEDLLRHKTVSELKIASAEFSRWIKYNDVTLDSLRGYRTELRAYINSLTPDTLPVFRANACIPLIVSK